MVSSSTILFQLVAFGLLGATIGNPISNDFKKGPLEIPGLKFLGATGNKEFYISRAMVTTLLKHNCTAKYRKLKDCHNFFYFVLS